MKKGLLMSAVAPICLMLTLGFTIGADYPTRPITMISPMAPGAGMISSQGRSAPWRRKRGKPLVVVNKRAPRG